MRVNIIYFFVYTHMSSLAGQMKCGNSLSTCSCTIFHWKRKVVQAKLQLSTHFSAFTFIACLTLSPSVDCFFSPGHIWSCLTFSPQTVAFSLGTFEHLYLTNSNLIWVALLSRFFTLFSSHLLSILLHPPVPSLLNLHFVTIEWFLFHLIFHFTFFYSTCTNQPCNHLGHFRSPSTATAKTHLYYRYLMWRGGNLNFELKLLFGFKKLLNWTLSYSSAKTKWTGIKLKRVNKRQSSCPLLLLLFLIFFIFSFTLLGLFGLFHCTCSTLFLSSVFVSINLYSPLDLTVVVVVDGIIIILLFQSSLQVNKE